MTLPEPALAEEHETLRALLETLRAEREALLGGDADAVARLAGDKSQRVERLGRHAEARRRSLAARGLPPDRDGVARWLAAEPAPLRRRWDALLALAAEARELNRVNGLLAGRRLARVQQSLAALHSAGSPGQLYGQDGRMLGAAAGTSRAQI